LYFHPDYTGNISYTTDSTGTVKTRIVYMPYGDAIILEGENNFRAKFNTHEQDKTGLQYFNARYYDAEIGRFAQADPTVPDPLNSQAYNRYMMCYGNPISFADIEGFEPTSSGPQGVTTSVAADGTMNYTPQVGAGGAPSGLTPAAADAPAASPATTTTESAEGESSGGNNTGKSGDSTNSDDSPKGSPTNSTAPRYITYTSLNQLAHYNTIDMLFKDYDPDGKKKLQQSLSPYDEHGRMQTPGVQVITLSILNDSALSFAGSIYCGSNVDASLIQHEYGHFLQQSRMGMMLYTKNVALPSAASFIVNIQVPTMVNSVLNCLNKVGINVQIPENRYKHMSKAFERNATQNACDFYGNNSSIYQNKFDYPREK